jgi:hypothetical protein
MLNIHMLTIHTRITVHLPTMCIYVHTYMHACMNTYTARAISHRAACTYAYIHTYIHTYGSIYNIRGHCCIHRAAAEHNRVYIQAYIHTYIHTYIHMAVYTTFADIDVFIDQLQNTIALFASLDQQSEEA